MIETFLFLSYFIYLFYEYIQNIFYFSKLVNDYILLRIYVRLTNKVNTKLTTYIYNDIINNGCFAIKFIQWVLSRFKIMYSSSEVPEWILLFHNFYEKCPIHPFNYTKELIEDEFQMNFEEVFNYFNTTPIASGSIAQVYKCKYKNKDCVLKVVHPDIKKKSWLPLKILNIISYIMKTSVGRKLYFIFPPLDMKHFINSLEEQLDLRIEAKNMIQMREDYSDDSEYIVIPECYFYSDKLIIMSYEGGDYFEDIKATSYTKYKIVLCLCCFSRSMSIIHGIIHSDLHCGNWKVRKIPNKNDYQLIIYDFGLVVKPDIHILRSFLIAWEKCNFNDLMCALIQYIEYNPYSKEEFETKKKVLKNRIEEWTIKPLQINRFLNILCSWASEYNIIYNSQFLNFAVAICLTESYFSEYGITGSNKKNEDCSETVECIFKVEYLNYINFCQTKKIFKGLSDYLEEILVKEKIQFSDLFHKVEYKLNINGIKIDTSDKIETSDKIDTSDKIEKKEQKIIASLDF